MSSLKLNDKKVIGLLQQVHDGLISTEVAYQELIKLEQENKNQLSHPDHPVWKLGKLLVLLLCCTLFSYINASNFDNTEVAFLIQFAVILFGAEGFEFFQKRRQK